MQIPGLNSSFAAGSLVGTAALDRTGKTLQKILEKLSTGQRINRASDDAAGLSISEQLDTQVRGFKMATQNVSDVMSQFNIADSTTAEVADMMQRQRELALESGNDTLTSQQRSSLDSEYQALNQEIDRIGKSANFNGQGVTNGQDLASGTAQAQVGPNSGDTITLPKIDINTMALGLAGTSIATGAGAQAALTSIDTAMNKLSDQRTTLGANFNRLESTINNLWVSMNNTQAAESVLREQDMASGISDLTRAQLLQEGSLKAFTRFNEIASNHLFTLLQ